MSNESEGNAQLTAVRETLEKAVSDVNRVLGLQGLRTGDEAAAARAVGESTLSITCSTYSIGCQPM